MMNKIRTERIHLVKFLFIVPMIAVMLLSFRNKLSQHEPATKKSPFQDTIPARPATPAKPAIPKNVKSISGVNGKITVTLKDGTSEKYDLNVPEENAVFEKKYGKMPEPPTPVEAPSEINVPKPPNAPEAPVMLPLPADVSTLEINNNKVVIKLKNGQMENYDLNQPDQKARFEKKYGDFAPKTPKTPKPPTPPREPAAPEAPVKDLNAVIISGAEPVIATNIQSTVSTAMTISADIVEIEPVIHTLSPGEKEETILEIGNQTSNDELTMLKKRLSSNGYTFTIVKTNYSNGSLQSIEANISDDNSKSRFAADDFNKIIISKITYKNGKSGFNIRVLTGTVRL